MRIFILIILLSTYSLAQNLLLFDDVAFSPADIDGLKMWLSIGTVDSITKDANGKVTNIADLSGNGNDATQADTSKSPTYDATNGFLFDGTDDNMVCTTTDMDLGTSDFTYEFWFDPTLASATLYLYARYQASSTRQEIFHTADDFSFIFNEFDPDVDNAFTSSSNPFADDGLHHLVVSYDNSDTCIVYVDGTPLALGATYNFTAGINATNSGGDYIASRTGTAAFFNGYIKAIRFYRKALTQAEVTQLYEYGAK